PAPVATAKAAAQCSAAPARKAPCFSHHDERAQLPCSPPNARPGCSLTVSGDAHALDCHANAAILVAVISPVTPNRVGSPRHVSAVPHTSLASLTLVPFGSRGNDRLVS